MRSTFLSLVCGLILCSVTVHSQHFMSGNYMTRGSFYPSYQTSYPNYQTSYPSQQSMYPSYGSRFTNYGSDDMFPDYNRPDYNSWDSPDSNSYAMTPYGGIYRYD